MAARGQRPIKGFRPGKEPPQLRKKRAREQFGELSGTQERLVDLFAERSPEESRKLLSRWTTALLVIAIVLAAVAALLYSWSVIATVVVGVLAVIAVVLWWRLRSQREAFDSMIDAVSASGGRKRKKRK
jgi:Flp pilus assembly protein TadB